MIDSRAIVDPGARLAPDVEVGPFAIVGPGVRVGAGTRIGPHAVLQGPTHIGERNHIHAFASVGCDPQDKKYAGERAELVIGDDNVIREYCTISRGTADGGGVTRVGDRNWIMAYVHIAHDCEVGSDTIFANSASLAGHVAIEDHVILGGFTLVHQFCRIGAHAFTGMGSVISMDVPPFVTVSGNPAAPHGINAEGLRRRDFSPAQIARIREAYRALYRSGLRLAEARTRIEALAREEPALAPLATFFDRAGRGILR